MCLRVCEQVLARRVYLGSSARQLQTKERVHYRHVELFEKVRLAISVLNLVGVFVCLFVSAGRQWRG
jgi:hypothetical protein